MPRDHHISGAELLQWLDGELTAGRAAAIGEHVRNCYPCLARQCELQDGLANYLQARSAALDRQVPPIDGPAARLAARLAARMRTMPPVTQVPPTWTLPAIALAAAMTLAGFWWLAWSHERPIKPDARLTPGKALALSREQVCAVPADDGQRIVPASLAGQVFTSYGIRPTPRSYEVDYLIAPALGGATDVLNLWPQPYAGGVWNARVKDALENQLRQLVCEGAVDLPTAQHEIATDWIATYRKYFQTDQPLAAHAHYLKDRPWE